MTQKQSIGSRLTSVFLAVALLFTMIPLTAIAGSAVSVNSNRVADPSTMDSWKDFFPTTGEISTENAGGVWMDKTVFTDASAFAGLGISQNHPNSFLVALSAMATNMSIAGMSHVPTDSILVLDVSGSMNDNVGNNDVAEELVAAANDSIDALLSTNKHNRVGVVLYSGPTTKGGSAGANDAVTILPLDRYTPASNGEYLTYNKTGRDDDTTESVSIHRNTVIEGTTSRPSAFSKTVVGATYIQKGIVLAMEQFVAELNSATIDDPVLGTLKRKPVVVLMSDGAPTVGSTNFTAPSSINLGDGTSTSAAIGFVSQLSAAYAKAKIEEKYGTDALFYTLGLGLSNNDDMAIGVMDPKNSHADTALDDFWNDIQTDRRGRVTFKGYNHLEVGETVALGHSRTVTKIATPLEQYYVDQYFAATGSGGDLAEDLAQAFADIVGAIQLQSTYFPTLVSESEELSGYISFVDKIGQYMNVTDIKGILIDDHLFSGADLASNFVADGGALGTFDSPTALGMEMVAAVRARLGLDSNDVAATLIEMAYKYGQLSYTDANHFSNYIGWYANAAGEFLGFYNEGTTVLPAATGNEATDPAFLIRSYGYLGAVDASHGVSESDMMYATVQVRKSIATGEELVTFAVPAALIPTISYNVTLKEDGSLTDLTVTGAKNPIRLVYEVALDDAINSFNIKEIVSDEYLNDPHNVNADGTVNFYTNQWDHDNKTDYGTVNTYGYFNPSRQNDKYYYLEDAPVYTDANGTLYTGSEQPSADGTFYRSYKVYKNNGSLRTEIVYRELSDAAKATAVQKNDGSWYIPKGNVYVNLDGYTVHKSDNPTGTLVESTIPFVDTQNHSVDDLGYEFYVGTTLGNNGEMTVIPATGIKLSKTMADGVADPEKAFVFDLFNTTDPRDGSIYAGWLVKADGTTEATSILFDDGNATVELYAGDVLYIGGMTANETFRIVERETAEYLATVTGLSETGTVTVNPNEIIPVAFVNDERGSGNLTIAKEVDHDFGVEYQIPVDKVFTMQVTLNGVGTANATFRAAHTNGTDTEITTDANGRFTIQLTHDQQFEIFELPAGTTAVVVEQNPGTGFAPAYWDNGEIGDGAVTVVADSTVSVMVINDYEVAEVYPVYITVSGSKHLSGTDWQEDYSFSFKLEKFLADGSWQQLGEIETATYGSTAFNFNDAFANERYVVPGSYYYRIVEIKPETPLGGFTYDKTVHSFSVHVSDADMDGQLEITEVVSDRPDTTVVSKTTDGYHVNASFTNTYSTSGTATATIDVTKTVSNLGGAEKSLAGYTFGLYDAVSGELVSTLVTTERGFARFVLTYEAASAEPYRYILKEVAPDPVPAGWNYSTEEIAVTVEVLDDGDGTISAVIYTGDEKPDDADTVIATTFTNEYNPTDATLAIDFVSKTINGRDLNNNEFTFEVQELSGATVLTGSNNAEGKVTFSSSLTFDTVGTYFYNIVETSKDGKGVTVDKTVYRIMVTVTDDNGALKTTYSIVNATGNTISFVNDYKASSVDYSVEGTKTLRGRTLINDEFTFVLTELTVDSIAVQEPRSWTARNFSNGSIVFPTITYDAPGTYVYSVEELVPEGGKAYGITYDTTRYKVTVVVRDNGEGELVIASESVALLNNTAANAISFLNEYEANPTWAQFIGNKTLTGKVNNALLGGEFEFELYNADDDWGRCSLKETVANGVGGVITFTKIDFTTDEDQYFIVAEKNGGEVIDGVTYDDTVYRVWAEVTDDLKGQLHAIVHIYDDEGIPQDAISFVNIYEITGSNIVTLSGEKIINGRDWKDSDSFTFELYDADENYNASGGAVKTATADFSNHNYTMTLNYTAQDVGKTFYYVLIEKNGGTTIDGVTYSRAMYRIKVIVEDNGKGGIQTTVAVIDATTSTLNFVNEYRAADATVTVEGSKTLMGRDLVDGEFKFFLIEADENFNVLKDGTTMIALNADGKFTFDELSFTKVGTYYFVVSEDATVNAERVSFDDTVYFVTIEVTDDEKGQLIASDPVIVKKGSADAVEVIEFTNVYTPKPADITVDIDITKTVVNKGSDIIGPEDFEFLLKDLADEVDGITVKSDENGKAKFTLTFTEDDIGKIFSYTLTEVDSGRASVTYSTAEYAISIAITLDEEINTLVATMTLNEVAATELAVAFENIYDPTPAYPDNPQTGDASNLSMWVALMFISGGATITLCGYNKRNRKQENM